MFNRKLTDVLAAEGTTWDECCAVGVLEKRLADRFPLADHELIEIAVGGAASGEVAIDVLLVVCNAMEMFYNRRGNPMKRGCASPRAFTQKCACVHGCSQQIAGTNTTGLCDTCVAILSLAQDHSDPSDVIALKSKEPALPCQHMCMAYPAVAEDQVNEDESTIVHLPPKSVCGMSRDSLRVCLVNWLIACVLTMSIHMSYCRSICRQLKKMAGGRTTRLTIGLLQRYLHFKLGVQRARYTF